MPCGTCPYCNNPVHAEWKEETICLQPWCNTCDKLLLEDEVDWEQPPPSKEYGAWG